MVTPGELLAAAIEMSDGSLWVAGTTVTPPGIHVMATPVHEPYAGEYVAAVAESIAAVRGGAGSDGTGARYN